jgi:hypothetical protein
MMACGPKMDKAQMLDWNDLRFFLAVTRKF